MLQGKYRIFFLLSYILLNLSQSLLDVVEDVFHVLDTHGETNQIGGDTSLEQLLVAELTVGVTGGMEYTGTRIGHVGHDIDHL